MSWIQFRHQKYAIVAQLVERTHGKGEVLGSIREEKIISDETKQVLDGAINEFNSVFAAEHEPAGAAS